MTALFTNQTTAGTGAIIDLSQEIRGGFINKTINAWGTWDSAVFTLEMTLDGSNWVTIADSTLLADGGYNISLRAVKIQARLASPGAGTSISAEVI